MTLDDLVEYAKRRIIAGAARSSPWGDVDLELTANVPAAAQLAARRIMHRHSERPRLQQVYSVALDGSGIGDLSAATGSVTTLTNEILIDGIWRFGTVIDGSNNVLQPILHYSDFLLPAPTAFGYYHINQQKRILTRALGTQVTSPADIASAASPVSITTSYCPTNVTDWPVECHDNLINALVELTLKKVPGGAVATS